MVLGTTLETVQKNDTDSVLCINLFILKKIKDFLHVQDAVVVIEAAQVRIAIGGDDIVVREVIGQAAVGVVLTVDWDDRRERIRRHVPLRLVARLFALVGLAAEFEAQQAIAEGLVERVTEMKRRE